MRGHRPAVSSALPWAIGLLTLLLAPPALAQRLDPVLLDSFLTDPLEVDPRDPLLPTPVVDRELSPLERYSLERSLFELDRQAAALLASDQPDQAFELWRREVQLRRLFGRDAELEAIRRVGQQAWNAQRSVEVRLLTVRLRQIWEEDRPTADTERVTTVAEISQILRAEDLTTETLEELIARADQRGNVALQHQYRALLAAHYLQWFNYDEAAQLYSGLAVQAEGDALVQEFYLEQLVHAHQEAKRFEAAIAAQSQLLALYRATNQRDREPPLEIAIARNYRSLNLNQQAMEYYQVAYGTAQILMQYNSISDILRDLGDWYTEQNRRNEALTMYNLLVRSEQQAYSQYGILEAYDHLGQLYRAAEDRDAALAAFQAGLGFARSLDYRQAYFQEQIALTSQLDPVASPADEQETDLRETIDLGEPILDGINRIRRSIGDNPPFDPPAALPE